jgi:hypothetical protein
MRLERRARPCEHKPAKPATPACFLSKSAAAVDDALGGSGAVAMASNS